MTTERFITLTLCCYVLIRQKSIERLRNLHQPDLVFLFFAVKFDATTWESTWEPTTLAKSDADSLCSSVSPTYNMLSNLLCKDQKRV